MMNTPICGFVTKYIKSKSDRLHMPGHKGMPYLGCEPLDITEIPGADSLYDADGIILESEKNASSLFHCRTFYSTEGSSHAIRAMLALVCTADNKKPIIWAGRNVHSTFISAAALLNFSVKWIYPDNKSSYLTCSIDSEILELELQAAEDIPTAIYLTSPDYLGNKADIKAISKVCRKHGILLLVDNAHGAYLSFLPISEHPIDLGADMCCASAHKTLPVLTGGAYLHVSENMPFSDTEVKEALRLFGSTSPSYLILQSLDMANRYIADEFRVKLGEFLPHISNAKERLISHGYTLIGTEPMKLTISAKEYGYMGYELAQYLEQKNIFAEFADPDYVVLMLSIDRAILDKLISELINIPKKACITASSPEFFIPQVRMSIREAMFSPFESVPIEKCAGRTLARASVGCPPAVPILVCGEVIDENAVNAFRYYSRDICNVVKL